MAGYNSRNYSSRRTEQELVQISKFLSYILRHGAEKEGFQISSGGYVRVADLLASRNLASKRVTFEEIQYVVETNEKKRYSLAQFEGQWFIRATQGHSLQTVDSDNLLRKMTFDDLPRYPTVVHGTTKEAYHLIKKSNCLKTMGRNHIHFALGLPGSSGVVSGMRNRSNVLLFLDARKCLIDRIPLYISENSVVLCPGIRNTNELPLQYIKRVTFR